MNTSDAYQKLHALLSQGISANLFTAAQCVIALPRSKRLSIALGKTRLPRFVSRAQCPVLDVTEHTLFDLASLTKPLATAALIMKAFEESVLQPNQKLISIAQGVFPSWLLSHTIEDLLTHSTPLNAWADFNHPSITPDTHEHAIKHALAYIHTMQPRQNTDECCYSDLGYILLGFILEQLYQTPLNKLFNEKIARPLKLYGKMMYTPLAYVDDKDCVATHPLFPKTALQGHPDDDNARAFVHVAGHAGLFSSASAVADYADALLNHRFPVSPKIIQYFTTYQAKHSTYALGWDRPTSANSLSGRLPGDPVIGHLGYTGCSLWMDLQTKRHITLLTNRSHTNTNPSSIAELRQEIHKIAWKL